MSLLVEGPARNTARGLGSESLDVVVEGF